MMVQRPLSVAALTVLTLAASSPAAEPAAPFAVADVDFTRDCAPNPALERLMTMFVPARPPEDAEWVFDEPLYNAVSGDVSQVLRLDNDADWHGLRLVEVRFDHGIERGPVNYRLGFADDPERVRDTWNARGWRLPPVGELREVEGLEGYAYVGVEADGELATVTCYRD